MVGKHSADGHCSRVPDDASGRCYEHL